MGQKINFFHMLKATKITVFGLVLACVFCGDLYADQVEVTGSVSASYSVDGAPVDEKALETAHVCAIDSTDKAKRCVLTDGRGAFKINMSCAGERLIISYVGCKPVTVDRSEIFDHNCGASVIEKSLDCVTEIDTVTATGCRKLELGINTGTLRGDECIPSSCVEPRWVLRGADDNARCVEQECRGGNWGYVGDVWECLDGEIIPVEPDDEVGDDVELPTQADDNTVDDDTIDDNTDYEALAEQAREREQSTGNKLLGAVGMGATGIGGSMLLSGMSETKSDEDAERAMKAYLSTFTCKYGNESVPGGTKNVEIPGGNELIQMYAEYVALANDLKVRKEALGMKPGIESEAILDSATSGLYDDVSTGKTKGAYASLARALSDPDSEDAKLWAAQREESDEKKKTGAIVAGIGAIGSLLGDIAINKIDWKAKQKKALRDLETSVANITPPKVKCPSEATGTYAPNCDCSAIGKNYNPNTNQCEEVETPRVVDTIDTSVAEVETVDVVNEVASTVTVERDDAADLSADAMFKFGESDLLPGAQTALDEFVNELRKENFSGCTITVVGHTDTKGGKGFNKNLSEARARSVATYLERPNFEDVIETVNPSGLGETECTCGLTVKSVETYKNDNKDACVNKTPGTPVPDETAFAPCRRVVVSLECNVRSAVGANSTGGNLGATLGTVTSIVTPQN